jgi:hypothetical protein
MKSTVIGVDLAKDVIWLCRKVWSRAFRILCQLILARDLRYHPSAHRSESPVETMSYSSSGLALSIS